MRPRSYLLIKRLNHCNIIILVDQRKCHISLIYPQKNGQWGIDYYTDMDAVIALSCPEMELAVKGIYLIYG